MIGQYKTAFGTFTSSTAMLRAARYERNVNAMSEFNAIYMPAPGSRRTKFIEYRYRLNWDKFSGRYKGTGMNPWIREVEDLDAGSPDGKRFYTRSRFPG